MPQITSQDTLLTEAQAAQFINLSPRFLQVRRLQSSGPKFIRISHRCIKYRVSDLLSWIESLTVDPKNSVQKNNSAKPLGEK